MQQLRQLHFHHAGSDAVIAAGRSVDDEKTRALVRALYRLRLHGIERHLPDEGPALIVCNHVSYMDALILAATIPRPVRFVMYYRIFNIPVMRWIFRTARAIPIAGVREDPALMQRALTAVRNDYSLARLYAMGADAWSLANHFAQMRQTPGFELNGNTGDLTATQDCVINRKLSWLKYQRGQIVAAN